jgi:hypothetical protein
MRPHGVQLTRSGELARVVGNLFSTSAQAALYFADKWDRGCEDRLGQGLKAEVWFGRLHEYTALGRRILRMT